MKPPGHASAGLYPPQRLATATAIVPAHYHSHLGARYDLRAVRPHHACRCCSSRVPSSRASLTADGSFRFRRSPSLTQSPALVFPMFSTASALAPSASDDHPHMRCVQNGSCQFGQFCWVKPVSNQLNTFYCSLNGLVRQARHKSPIWCGAGWARNLASFRPKCAQIYIQHSN
jgi:hypothetical protein